MKLAQAEANLIDLAPTGAYAENIQSLELTQIIGAAIILILVVAAIIFFFMLIIGGVKWMTSGGDKAQTEGARNQITAALIGLVIIFAAWAIVSLVSALFGVNLLQLEIPYVGDIGGGAAAPIEEGIFP